SRAPHDKWRQHCRDDILWCRESGAPFNVMGVAKASLEASTRYLAYDLGPKKVRVNCISAGPVNTLAARGISGFMSMLKYYQERSPLKRSREPADLGATGVVLVSHGAAG